MLVLLLLERGTGLLVLFASICRDEEVTRNTADTIFDQSDSPSPKFPRCLELVKLVLPLQEPLGCGQLVLLFFIIVLCQK